MRSKRVEGEGCSRGEKKKKGKFSPENDNKGGGGKNIVKSRAQDQFRAGRRRCNPPGQQRGSSCGGNEQLGRTKKSGAACSSVKPGMEKEENNGN